MRAAALVPGPVRAAGRGVAVAGADMRLTASSGVKPHIGNDDCEFGEKLTDESMRRLPSDATGIRGRFTGKLPGVVVLSPFDTQRDDAANRDAWKRLVAANPNALAFVGTGDCDGVNLASLRTGKSARWLVDGFGVDPRTARDGAMVASISPGHYLEGAVAGWFLARHAKGGAALPEDSFTEDPASWVRPLEQAR